MDHYTIGCDAHKHFSVFSVRDGRGQVCERCRVPHQRGAIRAYLSRFPHDTPVALEALGNWYWLVDEIEEAGCRPLLAHAGRAKVMMGHINKTDKLDADGLSLLLYLGTLPHVWIPPGELRDERELPRTRMALVHLRTTLKNRIHATLAEYGLQVEGATDIFVGRGRKALENLLPYLPPETRCCLEQELRLVDQLSEELGCLEERIRERIRFSRSLQLLKTLPGVGDILAVVLEREVGEAARFPDAEHFAAYAGTVPRIKASADRVRYGHLRPEANRYLKWVFMEAASVIAAHSQVQGWRTAMFAACMSGFGEDGGTPSPSGRSPVIWRRRPTGSCGKASPTVNPACLRRGERACFLA